MYSISKLKIGFYSRETILQLKQVAFDLKGREAEITPGYKEHLVSELSKLPKVALNHLLRANIYYLAEAAKEAYWRAYPLTDGSPLPTNNIK